MVNQRGQSVTEYIVMLALLTLIGVWLMNGVGGAPGLTSFSGKRGSIKNMSDTTTTKIANEK